MMVDASRFVNDGDIERILLGTYNREMTVSEMAEAFGIPIATCYRKARVLEDAGLLLESRSFMGRDGRIIKAYRTNIESAYVYCEDGRVKVRFKVLLEMARDFREKYEALTRSPPVARGNQ